MAYTRGGKTGKGITFKSGEPIPEKHRQRGKIPLHRGTGPDFAHITSTQRPPKQMDTQRPTDQRVRGSVEATARNPFGGGRAEIGEINSYHRGAHRNDLPELGFRRTDWEGPKVVPPHVDVRDMPPEGMEFYRTGAPDEEMGIRGEVRDYLQAPRYHPGDIYRSPENSSDIPEPMIPERTSVIGRIKELAMNWGGILDWPSLIGLKKTAKQLAGSIKNQIETAFEGERLGPDKLSAEENAEIDEIAYLIKTYPDVWEAIELARQGGNKTFVEMTDIEIAETIRDMEREPDSLGGRAIIKRKRRRNKQKGYSKSWNY